LFVGCVAGIVNVWVFLLLYSSNLPLEFATPTAFVIAAVVNYLLCIVFVFRHKARWGNLSEIVIYCGVVFTGAALDLLITKLVFNAGNSPAVAKITATALVLMFNFLGRRYVVFPLAGKGQW